MRTKITVKKIHSQILIRTDRTSRVHVVPATFDAACTMIESHFWRRLYKIDIGRTVALICVAPATGDSYQQYRPRELGFAATPSRPRSTTSSPSLCRLWNGRHSQDAPGLRLLSCRMRCRLQDCSTGRPEVVLAVELGQNARVGKGITTTWRLFYRALL